MLAERALTPLAAAAVALAVGALLTGALHLDALADTADALAGGSRERALEIMRDPRIGAYGALALVLDLLLKAAALSALLERDDAFLPLVAATALARAAAVPLAFPALRAPGPRRRRRPQRPGQRDLRLRLRIHPRGQQSRSTLGPSAPVSVAAAGRGAAHSRRVREQPASDGSPCLTKSLFEPRERHVRRADHGRDTPTARLPPQPRRGGESR